jgi:hypothetical protein
MAFRAYLIVMFIGTSCMADAQTQQTEVPHKSCTMTIDSARVDNTQTSQALLFNACNQEVQATWFNDTAEAFSTILQAGDVIKTSASVANIKSVVSCLPKQTYNQTTKACTTEGNAKLITADRFAVWPTGSDWSQVVAPNPGMIFRARQQNIVFALKDRISIVECMAFIGIDKKIKAAKCTGGATKQLDQDSEKWFTKQSLEKLKSMTVENEKWIPTPAILWFARDVLNIKAPNVYSPLGILKIEGYRVAYKGGS